MQQNLESFEPFELKIKYRFDGCRCVCVGGGGGGGGGGQNGASMQPLILLNMKNLNKIKSPIFVCCFLCFQKQIFSFVKQCPYTDGTLTSHKKRKKEINEKPRLQNVHPKTNQIRASVCSNHI